MDVADIRPIVAAVLDGYALPVWGAHGVGHWGRVLENGRRLAAETGADLSVVTLFAVFHDARRLNEFTDAEHGRRGAALATELHGTLFDAPEAALAALCEACERHTSGRTDADVTVQTCWDADRLDLGRVGTAPAPARLCTAPARRAETIRWAEARSRSGYVPAFVTEEWGVALSDAARPPPTATGRRPGV